MAESTEITFGYMRDFRKEKILPMLTDLKEQRSALDDYIDEGKDGPVIRGIRAGNEKIFPDGGTFASTVNNSVRLMREEIDALIEEFEGLDKRLEQADIRFEDTENDSVLTAYELAVLIDPENAAGARAGSANPFGGGDDEK